MLLELLLHSALVKLSAPHMQFPVGQCRTVTTQQISHKELCYESLPHGYHDLHNIDNLKNAGEIEQIMLLRLWRMQAAPVFSGSPQ